MARYLGKEGSVVVDATAIGEVKSFELTLEREAAQGIALGDTWMSSDYGDGQWSGTVTCHFDPDDTSQAALETDLTGGSKAALKLYVEGSASGDWQFSGNAVITSMGGNVSANGEYTERTFAFTGDGAPTIDTVA